MELASIIVQPNFVAVNEVGNRTINKLAEQLRTFGTVTYEPGESPIIIREGQEGAGAEFWEIIEIVLEAITAGVAAEVTRRVINHVRAWGKGDLHEHPYNTQEGLPWKGRRMRIDVKTIYQDADGRRIESKQSIELASEEADTDNQ